MLIDRANEIIDRLVALDEATANGRAFCALLQSLHARDLSIVKEPHVTAIHMVRAGILRAAIGTVMACLDPPDQRGNRASVGQILEMLKDETVLATLQGRDTPSADAIEARKRARDSYDALVAGDLLKRGKQLRNNSIAHVLIPDTPTPEVTYETIYKLQDAVEALVAALYQTCCRGKPHFLDHQASLIEHAEIFWRNYFSTMINDTAP